MPKDVAQSTSKNLYKLCADLNRLSEFLVGFSPICVLSRHCPARLEIVGWAGNMIDQTMSTALCLNVIDL